MAGHEEWFAPGGGKEAIDGFISPRGARAISAILAHQATAGHTGNLAEIGTFYGKTFIGLAFAANPGEIVLGLDIYPDEMQRRLSSSLDARLPGEIDFHPRLVKADSATVSKQAWRDLLQQKAARFVHVDGDHTGAAVLNDIKLATSLLTPEAVVVVDDFLHDWYPDVTDGVLEALRVVRSIRPVAVIPRTGALIGGGTKLVCAAPGVVGAYRTLMRETFSELRVREGKISGFPVLSFINED
jgi:predicted O-methyltransferase YrrM